MKKVHTWPAAVGECDGERPDVVRHHSVGHVHAVLVLLANLPGIWSGASALLDGFKDGNEEVGVVVGRLVLLGDMGVSFATLTEL